MAYYIKKFYKDGVEYVVPKGDPGPPGTSVVGPRGKGIARIEVEESPHFSGDNTVTIVDDDNEGTTFHVKNGDGIHEIYQTQKSLVSGGVNELTIVDTAGRTSAFEVRNGLQGPPGPPGPGVIPGEGDLVLSQETGQDMTAVMSQKAITDAIHDAVTEDVANVVMKGKTSMRVWLNTENTLGPMVAGPWFYDAQGGTAEPGIPVISDLGDDDEENVIPEGHALIKLSTLYKLYCAPVHAGDHLILHYYPGTSSSSTEDIYTFISDKEPAPGIHLNIFTAVSNTSDNPDISGKTRFFSDNGAAPEFDIVEDGFFWVYVTRKNNVSLQKTVGVKSDVVNLRKDIEELQEGTSIFNSIDISNQKVYKMLISPLGDDPLYKWHNQGSGKNECIVVRVNPNQRYRISAVLPFRYCFLTDKKNINATATPHWAEGYTTTILVEAGGSVTVTAPTDAYYLYLVTMNTAGEPTGVKLETPQPIADTVSGLIDTVSTLGTGGSGGGNEVSTEAMKIIGNIIGNPLTRLNAICDSEGWEIPQTVQERNVQIKAAQMSQIEWMPRGVIPDYDSNGHFSPWLPEENASYPYGHAGPIIGLPYSSTKEINKFIGLDVSIYTFMSAVNNPYSLLYTECLLAIHAKSAWGRTYNGVNCGPYYGVVCSVFTGYCTGKVTHEETGFDDWLSKNRFRLIRVHDQSAQGVRIGDFIHTQGHHRLVTGIKRNSNGDIINVEMYEARGAKIRKYPNDEGAWPATRTFFNNILKPTGSEKAVIYRNTELYKNTDYEKGPLFNNDGTVKSDFQYNNDICTYAGDRVSFREGELVVLNYNLNNESGWGSEWDAIEVYKNDSLYYTYQLSSIDQSALPESQQGHALKLVGLEYGDYKARLVNSESPDSSPSDYTYWEIIQADVTYSRSGNVDVVEWTSTNGTPIAMGLHTKNGGRAGFDFLPESAINSRRYVLDMVKLMNEQGNLAYTTSGSVRYLKIFFKGKYGQVTSEGIAVSWTV